MTVWISWNVNASKMHLLQNKWKKKRWKTHRLTWSSVHDVMRVVLWSHFTLSSMTKLTFLIWLLINFGNPNHPKSKITTNAVPEPIATFPESFIFLAIETFQNFTKTNWQRNKRASFKIWPRFIHSKREN